MKDMPLIVARDVSAAHTELRKQLDEGRVLWPDQARRLLDENERLREALAWIAYDSRPLNLDGHFDPSEWWKHVASTRREHAIAALTKGARS